MADPTSTPPPLRVRVEPAPDALAGVAEPYPLLAFHRFGRGDSFHVAQALSLHEPTDLGLLALPPSTAYLELPRELGGPCRFALGYVALLDGRHGAVRAWCPRVRLVHLPEPFPVERFRAATRERRPPDVTAEDLDKLLAEVARLATGVSFAEVWRPSRSLLGFRPLGGEVVAAPDALSWPPTHF